MFDIEPEDRFSVTSSKSQKRKNADSDPKPLRQEPLMKRSKQNKTQNGNPRSGGKNSASKRFRGGLFLLRWTFVLGIWAAVAGAGVLIYFGHDLPDPRQALEFSRRSGVKIYDQHGQFLASYGDLYGKVVSVEDLPEHTIQAILAIEDRRFFSHSGADPIGILRAFVHNFQRGELREGASTITQQLAKNLFLTSDRTLERKIQELMLALWLEYRFTKNQILDLYMNRVYLGAGTYGIDAAAQKYFHKTATELTLYESALIAGLLKAPAKFNPLANPDLTLRRTKTVLNAMVDAGFISSSAAEQALLNPPDLISSRMIPGRHYIDWLAEQIDQFAETQTVDIEVFSTLDPKIQMAAQDAVSTVLANQNELEAALVVMTHDGAIRAMVGGKSYHDQQFNRATQALRQPGSAFKPFIYLAAIEEGFTPDDMVEDGPITIEGWSPKNFKDEYYGPVTLRYALAQSLNTVAVRLTENVGRHKVVATAHRLGVTSKLKADPSISLGAHEVTLLELTGAYAAFANGGFLAIPYGISHIKPVHHDSNSDFVDEPLFVHQPTIDQKIIEPDIVFAMNELLSGVVSSGTAVGAQMNIPVAGKTGTSNDHRDAWFVGYTPDYVVGVWVGRDDNRPVKGLVGGNFPVKIWKSAVSQIYNTKP